jgi:hypothetical protein
VIAQAQEQNHDAAHVATVYCVLESASTQLSGIFVDAPVENSGYGYGDAVNVVHADLTTGTTATVDFSCERFGSESTEVDVNNPSLSAIQVATIN